MSTAELFASFLSNLAVGNAELISMRYGEITQALNKRFRDTESGTANSLQVGSFGRKTGIGGISDLDMLYIMPLSSWATYSQGGQLKLLQDARDAIQNRYPTTKVRVDRLVVTVTFSNFHFEIQPVFEQSDSSYVYPDTKNGGTWKVTKPRAEMTAIAQLDAGKNGNLRHLCKMIRAWRNKCGIGMGGLVIDTLAYKFFQQTSEYDTKSYLYYDWICRDFFKYISELPIQGEYSAPGSNQRVRVKKSFQRKAKEALALCLDAIESENQANRNDKWRKLFGKPFPSTASAFAESTSVTKWDNTEEFIDDIFPIDLRDNLKIDCDVKQNGFRERSLLEMLSQFIPLLANKDLVFLVTEITVLPPYEIYWKVLNKGEIAERKNCIRGQIVKDLGSERKVESTTFRGEHMVECYCVKDGVVVAMDAIKVPITTNKDPND